MEATGFQTLSFDNSFSCTIIISIITWIFAVISFQISSSLDKNIYTFFKIEFSLL